MATTKSTKPIPLFTLGEVRKINPEDIKRNIRGKYEDLYKAIDNLQVNQSQLVWMDKEHHKSAMGSVYTYTRRAWKGKRAIRIIPREKGFEVIRLI